MTGCYNGRDVHCFGGLHGNGNFTEAKPKVALEQELTAFHTFFSEMLSLETPEIIIIFHFNDSSTLNEYRDPAAFPKFIHFFNTENKFQSLYLHIQHTADDKS